MGVRFGWELLWGGLGMTTGRERFIRQIESAADRAGIMPPDEIAALFRRAVLRLRNTEGLVSFGT